MPDIEKILLPDGVTYNLSDAGALHLADLPSTAGTYALKVTIVGGVPTYTWVKTDPIYVMYSNSVNRSVSEVNYTMEVTVNDT